MIAQALASNGAKKVYILGRRMDALAETAASCPDSIIPIVCDVTCKDSLQAAADQVTSGSGYINMLWCNSGTPGPECAAINATTSLDDFVKHNWAPSVDDYTSTFKVNTAGCWYTAIAFLQLLDRGNAQTTYNSQIVATCSTLGFGRFAATGRFAYGQSKASQMHLMKQLGTHLVPYGIRVNMVAPGRKCAAALWQKFTANEFGWLNSVPNGHDNVHDVYRIRRFQADSRGPRWFCAGHCWPRVILG